MSQSRCSRVNATPIQASPAFGCAFWRAGSGDGLPAGWMPVGFVLWGGPKIYGNALASVAPPVSRHPAKPHLPCDQVEFDQKSEAATWRITDALLSRAGRA